VAGAQTAGAKTNELVQRLESEKVQQLPADNGNQKDIEYPAWLEGTWQVCHGSLWCMRGSLLSMVASCAVLFAVSLLSLSSSSLSRSLCLSHVHVMRKYERL